MKKPYSRVALLGFMGLFLSILLSVVFAWQEQAATKPAKNVGNIIDDTIITAKVKAALLSHSTAQGLNLSVETSQGEVRLSGTVDTMEQARQAVTAARTVERIKTVKDDISVKPCPERELC